MSFVSFLQEKKSSPLLFFLEEKTVSLRGKRRFSDGRTQAHPALSSVGIPQRVCLPPPPCLCPCPPRLRASFPVQADHAKESQLRSSFLSAFLLLSPTCNTKRTVHIRTVRFFRSYAGRAEEHLFLDQSSIPQCLLFLFFKKRKRSPSFLFRRKEAKENQMRSSWLSVLLLLSPARYTKRTVHIRTVRFFVAGRM